MPPSTTANLHPAPLRGRMQANAFSPYALKDLHQAIDLIDRKLAFARAGETFASEEARELHLRRLSSKRAALVKSAHALTALGVQCDPQFLPRSFVHPVEGEAPSAPPPPPEAKISAKPARPRQKRR